MTPLFQSTYGEQNREWNRLMAGVVPPYKLAAGPSDLIPTDPAVVWGMDWSGYWNGVPDLSIFKNRGGKFCVIKICDGTVPTKDYAINVANSKAQGLVTLGYFWLYPNWFISGGGQARAWWSIAKDLELDGFWIDYEWTWVNGKLNNPDRDDLEGAAAPFEDLAGKKMDIYSAPSYLKEYPLNYATRKLAIANYGVMSPMTTPPWPVNGHTWHQRSEAANAQELGFDPYVCKAADLDIFNGTNDDFEDLYGTVVPEPEDDVTRHIEGTVKGTLKIRNAPNGIELGKYLYSGWTIEASENSAQWLHLTKINGVPVTDTEWASAGSSQQYISWSWVDDPVPPEPPPPPAVETMKSNFIFQVVDDAGTVLKTFKATNVVMTKE